jgi:predicted Fe-Mo cluster-binding NifX family protein
MKIAVTAQGPEIGSAVDPRFGRAQYFVVVDTDTQLAEAVDNQVNLNAGQGAGIQAARRVADLGVQAVLTGNVGPKAYAALQAAGVTVYAGAAGTVGEAVEQFRAGQLTAASEPTVEGHWT